MNGKVISRTRTDWCKIERETSVWMKDKCYLLQYRHCTGDTGNVWNGIRGGGIGNLNLILLKLLVSFAVRICFHQQPTHKIRLTICKRKFLRWIHTLYFAVIFNIRIPFDQCMIHMHFIRIFSNLKFQTEWMRFNARKLNKDWTIHQSNSHEDHQWQTS